MRIPVEKVAEALRMGVERTRDADEQVRIGVYVEPGAAPAIIGAVRGALVPQRTNALVRVERLGAHPVVPKADTDVALVLTGGSVHLQAQVQRLVVAGIPTVCLSQSSVEVPFIKTDTPMLGLISSTNKTYLLETLARWILDRTDKQLAFAANFPFMRIAQAHRLVSSAALRNAATGALVFVPGSNYPVMTLAQIQMQLSLAETYGRGLKVERAYEAAAVALAGLALRGAARLVCRRTPHISFLVKALIGGAGTYAMGRALMAYYDQQMSVSDLLARARARTRRTSPLPVSESY